MSQIHYSDFTPVEKAVYDRGFREIAGEVRSLLSNLESRGSVRRSAIDSVTTYIARLRATCSHPTVGAHGMQRSQLQRQRMAAQADKRQEKEKEKERRERPMTMAQIAEMLKDEAALKCQEDQQTALFHVAGAASLLRMQFEYHTSPEEYHRAKRGTSNTFVDPPTLTLKKRLEFLEASISSYVDGLKLQDSNVASFKYDKLQRIHVLHNASKNVGLLDAYSAISPERRRQKQLWDSELTNMKTQYMGLRVLSWGQTLTGVKSALEKFTEARQECNRARPKETGFWWERLFRFLEAYDRQYFPGDSTRKEEDKEGLRPVLVKTINARTEQMLQNTAGGLFLIDLDGKDKNKPGASNKRQQDVERQRLEARVAAGDNQNLPNSYDSFEGLATFNDYVRKHNVIERYTAYADNEEVNSVLEVRSYGAARSKALLTPLTH